MCAAYLTAFGSGDLPVREEVAAERASRDLGSGFVTSKIKKIKTTTVHKSTLIYLTAVRYTTVLNRDLVRTVLGGNLLLDQVLY